MAGMLPRLAEALAPVRDISAQVLPPGWQETPGFTLVFGALFLVSLAGWWQVDIPRRKAALLASCSMSLLHGWLCSTGAYQQLLAWPRLELDLPNSAAQTRIAEFSLAYMVADFAFYLVPFEPSDLKFVVHHAISAFYLFAVLHLRRGAISALLMFYLGEVTSPVLNLFTLAKELRHTSKAAARLFRVVSPIFTVMYILVRSVIGPPMVLYFTYCLWFRSPGLPLAWRVPMGACVTLGICGSQVWTVLLLRGLVRLRRKARQALLSKMD